MSRTIDPRDNTLFASPAEQIEALKGAVDRLEAIIAPLYGAVEHEARLQPRLQSNTDWATLAKNIAQSLMSSGTSRPAAFSGPIATEWARNRSARGGDMQMHDASHTRTEVSPEYGLAQDVAATQQGV